MKIGISHYLSKGKIELMKTQSRFDSTYFMEKPNSKRSVNILREKSNKREGKEKKKKGKKRRK